MKVKIIKGTNQIGGCITEITSNKGTKILIDYGYDLDDETRDKSVEGLTYGTKLYDAVFISHIHMDHIGLISNILPGIPIYIETTSFKLYEISENFSGREIRDDIHLFHFKDEILIDDIKVIPYFVEHSAYNSCMFKIECDDKTILYSGDYRLSGYLKDKFISSIKEIGHVDLLITEDTSVDRNNEETLCEEDVPQEIYDQCKNYDQILILQSTINIERIESCVRECKLEGRGRRYLIEDFFMASLTEVIPDFNIQPSRQLVRVYFPKYFKYKKEVFKEKYKIENFFKYTAKNVIKKRFIMNVRTSMLNDIKSMKKYNELTNPCLVYSMWEGYIEDKFTSFMDAINKMGIPVIKIHASGHATIDEIIEFCTLVNPDKIIAIHTKNNRYLENYFHDKLLIKNDSEEFDV